MPDRLLWRLIQHPFVHERSLMADLQTVMLEPRQLAVARWALMDWLHDELEITEDLTRRAVEDADGNLVVADARSSARRVRDALDALDAFGWPDNDRQEARRPADERAVA
jgi:hypothetical protein